MKSKSKKEFTPKQLKFWCITFFILAILLLFIGIVTIPNGLLLIILGIICVLLSESYAKERQKRISSKQSLSEIRQELHPEMPVNTGILNKSPKIKQEKHNISGTSFCQREIKSLGYENDCYFLSNRELKEEYIGEKIYLTEFAPKNTQLIPEADNVHDKNAIKVIVDGVHVGYIKKGSCSHIKKLLSSGKICGIDADIYGGKYKYIYEDENENGNSTVEIEEGDSDFFVKITIYTEEL